MNVVAISTSVLEFFTKKKLSKAEKRNQQAINQLKSAKSNVDRTSFEYRKVQADTLIQLTKVNQMASEIGERVALQSVKADKIKALLQDIEE